MSGSIAALLQGITGRGGVGSEGDNAAFANNPEAAGALRRRRLADQLRLSGQQQPITSHWGGLAHALTQGLAGYQGAQADRELQDIGDRRVADRDRIMSGLQSGSPTAPPPDAAQPQPRMMLADGGAPPEQPSTPAPQSVAGSMTAGMPQGPQAPATPVAAGLAAGAPVNHGAQADRLMGAAAELAGLGFPREAAQLQAQAQAALRREAREDTQAAQAEARAEAQRNRQAMLASRPARAAEELMIVQTPEGPRYVPRSRAVGMEPARTPSQGGGGPFSGNAMDAQALNMLLAPNADPAAPQYGAAFTHLYGPRTQIQQDGTISTIQPPVPDGIRRPGAAPQAAGPAPVVQDVDREWQATQPPPPVVPQAPPPAASMPPGTTTTPLPGGGNATRVQGQPPRLTASEVNMREETENALAAAQNARRSLQRALDLSATAYAGPFAELRGRAAGTTGMDAPTAEATARFSSTMTEQALGQLRAIFGGAPTEGERQILLKMQGSPGMSRVEREAVIRDAVAAVEAREARARARLQDIVSGNYSRVDPGYTPPAGAPPHTPPPRGGPAPPPGFEVVR